MESWLHQRLCLGTSRSLKGVGQTTSTYYQKEETARYVIKFAVVFKKSRQFSKARPANKKTRSECSEQKCVNSGII